MTSKKKTLLLISLGVLLLLAGGASWYLLVRQQDPSGSRSRRKVVVAETPDSRVAGEFTLTEGTYYQLLFNADTAFFVVDQINDDEIRGDYYLVEPGSDCVSPRPYQLSTHRRSVRIKIEGSEFQFKVRARQFRRYLDGERHLVVSTDDKGINFSVQPYVEPPFQHYSSQRYRKEIYPVQTYRDINYGQAQGYWTSMVGNENESYARIVKEGIKNSLSPRDLDLNLDLYLPDEGADTLIPNHSHRIRRPLVLFLHGGAFYVGDKSDSAIVAWCKHFAAMGYVAASANYRMGFLPTKKDIERTGYMATQDAHAAMRFLVANADHYLIDTTRLFVAGASAGSITALNVAFMRNRNRPETSFGKEGAPARGSKKSQRKAPAADDSVQSRRPHPRTGDLGRIQSTGNDINTTFRILAVANLWGAVSDLSILSNSRTAIVSFHGDADQLVPYDHGYPFTDISDKLGRRLFSQMYGSASIHAKAQSLGLTSKLHTFPGAGHAPHLNPDRSINQANFSYIRDTMTQFFYQAMVPQPAVIEQDPYNPRHYYISNPNIVQTLWKIEGGFILSVSGTDLWIVWREEDLRYRKISASGYYLNTIPYYVEQEPE